MSEAEVIKPASSVTRQMVELHFTPCRLQEESLKGRTAVVVDVLRAATSIVMALANGAKYVIPASSIEAAIDLASQLPKDDMLLCGEREGKLIEGFDVGNSPTDYTRERVRARRLIFGSTNGSPTLVRASVARQVYLSGFSNLNAIVDRLVSSDDIFPLAIVCSGKHNRFSIEDAVCGGVLLKRILGKLDIKPELNDAAKAAILMADEMGDNFLDLLYNSDHGKYLISIGMEEDLPHCAADSIYSIVPVLEEDKLKSV